MTIREDLEIRRQLRRLYQKRRKLRSSIQNQRRSIIAALNRGEPKTEIARANDVPVSYVDKLAKEKRPPTPGQRLIARRRKAFDQRPPAERTQSEPPQAPEATTSPDPPA